MRRNVVSKRRIDSNRRSAKRSTGPTTERGKVVARLNLIKASMFAKDSLVVRGDCPDDSAAFAKLLGDLRAQFQPTGCIEETLVERIATLLWRLKRAQLFEVGSIREGLDEAEAPARLTRRKLRHIDGPVRIADRDAPNDRGAPLATAQDLSAAIARVNVKRRTIEMLIYQLDGEAFDPETGVGEISGLAFANLARMVRQYARDLGVHADDDLHLAMPKNESDDPAQDLLETMAARNAQKAMERFFATAPDLPRIRFDPSAVASDDAIASDPCNETAPADASDGALSHDGAVSPDATVSSVAQAAPASEPNTAADACAPEAQSCEDSQSDNEEPANPHVRLHAACLDTAQRILAELDSRVRVLKRDLPTIKRYDSLRAERRRLLGQLPSGASFGQQIRYENMLDRQLHRALRELTELQNSRKEPQE